MTGNADGKAYARSAAVVVLHDDAAYLAASIAAVRNAGPVLAFVSRLPWHGDPGDWERAGEIARDAGAEVILGDWADETEHRRAALDHAREKGFTHVLIPDGDEIIERKLLETLLQIAEHELAERVFAHMDTFWKSGRYVIRPREVITPAILLDLRVVKHEHIREFTGGRPLLLSPEHGVIRHMSYAGSNERILRKITTWSHRDEVVPGWYENVWLGWDENKLMRNLHPTHPGAYGFAERVFTAEDAEEGKGSREDAETRSAEVGQGLLDRICRMNRMYRDHRAGARWSGQRARRAVCSRMEVPVMTERGSVSGKAGQRRSRPRRAAPPTPDALHPTPVRNNENRMLNELRPSGANHTMTYHGNGLRWSSQRGGSSQIVSYIWLEQDVLNTYLQTGLQVRYDVVDGEILAERRGAERYLYVPDPLGTVQHLLNPSQTKVATYTFSPYGETVALTGVELPAQFVGALGYHTLTTNRVYVRARWYRPDLGRWMTPDPIGFAGGDWNTHRYAASTPVTEPDPSGMDLCDALYSLCRQGAERWYRNCLANSQQSLEACLGNCKKKCAWYAPWCWASCLEDCAWRFAGRTIWCVVAFAGMEIGCDLAWDWCKSRDWLCELLGAGGTDSELRRRTCCRASCKEVGPTPPCGRIANAVGCGNTESEAVTAARNAACRALNPVRPPCHPKHGTAKPRCWKE